MAAVRLTLFAALTFGLAALGIYWVVDRSGIHPSQLADLSQLGAGTSAALVVLCALLYLTDIQRYRVLGAAIDTPVSWRAGLEASVANLFFSWLTPGAAMGAPAAIYMLHRRGIPASAGAVISFGKSATGTVFLLAATTAALATGAGLSLGPAFEAALALGAATVALVIALPLLLARWPHASRDRIRAAAAALGRWPIASRFESTLQRAGEGLIRAIERVVLLRRGGLRLIWKLFVAHALYMSAFAGAAVLLATAYGAPLGPAVAASVVFLGFSYVAPTPGGAGLAEAAGLPLFAPLCGDEGAVMVTLGFRFATFYAQIAAGFLFLAWQGTLVGVARSRGDES